MNSSINIANHLVNGLDVPLFSADSVMQRYRDSTPKDHVTASMVRDGGVRFSVYARGYQSYESSSGRHKTAPNVTCWFESGRSCAEVVFLATAVRLRVVRDSIGQHEHTPTSATALPICRA